MRANRGQTEREKEGRKEGRDGSYLLELLRPDDRLVHGVREGERSELEDGALEVGEGGVVHAPVLAELVARDACACIGEEDEAEEEAEHEEE